MQQTARLSIIQNIDRPRLPLMTKQLPPSRRSGVTTSPVKAVGLLMGLAAATPALGSPFPGIPLRPWHVFVLLAFAFAVFHRIRARGLLIPKLPALDLAVLLTVFVTGVVEIFNAGYLNYAPDYIIVLRPAIWLVIYWSARYTVSSIEDARKLLKWFILPAFPSVALGFAQVLGVEAVQQAIATLAPDGTGFINRLESGGLIRATAFVQHWTSFGSYLCTIAAAGGSLLILSHVYGIGRPAAAWLTLAVCGLGVMCTFTLAPIVTVLVISVVSAMVARAIGRIALIVAIAGFLSAATLGPLLAERFHQQFEMKRGATSDSGLNLVPSTLLYRYHIWISETVPMIAERPATGWGTNVYELLTGKVDRDRIYPTGLAHISAESQWLYFMMTFGAIGLSSFVLVIIAVGRLVRQGFVAGARWIAVPLAALLLISLLSSTTAPVYTNHGLPTGMWLLLGLLAAFVGSQALRGRQSLHHAP